LAMPALQPRLPDALASGHRHSGRLRGAFICGTTRPGNGVVRACRAGLERPAASTAAGKLPHRVPGARRESG